MEEKSATMPSKATTPLEHFTQQLIIVRTKSRIKNDNKPSLAACYQVLPTTSSSLTTYCDQFKNQ
jgi:hypothetical protein